MSLAVFAITHQTAPIEVRERFAFDAATQRALLQYLVRSGHAAEAVLLATCNRTELYVHLPSTRCPAVLLRLLARQAGLSDVDVRGIVMRRYDRDAAEHLLRVASGLESLVLGEAQIQGQVREAFARASGGDGPERLVGPVLSRLFQTALGVGGRVRSETQLGAGATSAASTAVALAARSLGSLAGRRALVIGAGEMARLAVQSLAKAGAAEVLVANRTLQRARQLAREVPATVVEIGDLVAALATVDVLITATAAPHVVVSEAQVREARAHAAGPLVVLDLAVPRDVEPGVGSIDGVQLFTTDALDRRVQQNLAQRQAMVPAAEAIVRAGTDAFWQWYGEREVVPLIRAIRDRAESLRQQEAARLLNRLHHLSPADREAIDALTRRLLNKVLHQPTVRLRGAAGDAGNGAVVHAARYLFDVDAA